MNKASDANSSSFSYKTLDELVKACVAFYNNHGDKAVEGSEVHHRREQLTKWIRKFHEDCGTLSPQVEESINNMQNGSCIFLMTAHQPNLFAYGGVLRKATLNHVLAEKLSRRLNLPVVNFFGLADQDFTDDRWVRSALLPDVSRRDGVLELRAALPEKMMLNKVGKPSKHILDTWQQSILEWIKRNFAEAGRFLTSHGVKGFSIGLLSQNFEEFWSIVEDSCTKAISYSDFNGYLMSKIVNAVWGYRTLFARFSECQQIFEPQFRILLSRFDEYSRFLDEALAKGKESGGVYDQESGTVPFWFHCDCGSKARLMAERQGEYLAGRGSCVRCQKEYRVSLSLDTGLDISAILPRISARSLAMPLVFFEGLGVCCYVGGVGGKEYLEQARYVADHMGLAFPPVVVWRPRDSYLGVGQLGALSVFRSLSGSSDLSKYGKFRQELEEKVSRVRGEIELVECQKRRLASEAGIEKDEFVERMKTLSARQDQIRKENDFSLLVRNLKLMENVQVVRSLYPCIVDYALSVGLKETDEQWRTFLEENGDLSRDVHLDGSLDKFLPNELLEVSN